MKTNITIEVKKVSNNGISIIADWIKESKDSSTNSMLYMENAYTIEDNKIILDPFLVKILETRYCIDSKEVLNCLVNNVPYALVPNENFKSDWDFSTWLANTRNQLHSELRFPYSVSVCDGNKGWDVFYFRKDELEAFKKSRGTKETSIFLDDIDNKYNFKNWIVEYNVKFNDYVLVNEKERVDSICTKNTNPLSNQRLVQAL